MKEVGGRQIWGVSDVTKAIARRLEDPPIPNLWVEGEVTNLNRAANGGVWFTLSDGTELGCSINSVDWERLKLQPKNGDRIVAWGQVQYWAQRNRITFWASRIELGGDGLLLAEIERLRRLLREEGLIPGRSRPIPEVPARIGLVTSAGAAAYTDVMRVIGERWPAADVVLKEAQVQGDPASEAVAGALAAVGREPGVEVVLLVRGGGSLEDLMAFNDERVCRAVWSCPHPVVTGIGHERDNVLADEVADLRCATPTAAAGEVTPDAAELLGLLDDSARRLNVSLKRASSSAQQAVVRAESALGRGLRERGRAGRIRIDGLAMRLNNGVARPVMAAPELLGQRSARLSAALTRRVEQSAARISGADGRLALSSKARLRDASGRLEAAGSMLSALSPDATLSRGYAIVRRAEGKVQPEAEGVSVGDALDVQFRDGRIAARVEGVDDD